MHWSNYTNAQWGNYCNPSTKKRSTYNKGGHAKPFLPREKENQSQIERMKSKIAQILCMQRRKRGI